MGRDVPGAATGSAACPGPGACWQVLSVGVIEVQGLAMDQVSAGKGRKLSLGVEILECRGQSLAMDWVSAC